ncbi:MAG: right-handed parallel beta-helix repeat-containing protein [Chloroflexi bacterium]|nr:right-handed parallel beta-helix repeat-containing protein [Chloroflexota bacterium]
MREFKTGGWGIRTLLTALAALILLLTASPVVQSAPAWDEDINPGYGAEANPTGNPTGGGAGYSNIITSGDYAVGSRDQFLAALSSLSGMSESARAGKIIYIEQSANIDMGGGTYGTLNLSVPSGTTIASNRGWKGSAGGRIYWSMPSVLPHFDHFLVAGKNVTFNGIRLQGPDGNIGSSGSAPLIDGIYSAGKTGLVVENCEIYNWPYAGIAYYSDRLPGLGSPSKAYIHHNYIHHCRRSGLGYGVQIGASSALIEANIFDYCRHAIAGERGYPASNYEARFNIVEPHMTNTMFDMHGGNDDPSWGFDNGPDRSVPAGGTILIHHNTFKSRSQISVGIRGVPTNVCMVYNNWTYWSSAEFSTAFKQRLERLRLTPYVNMLVYDNWFGTVPPVVSPNSTPIAPALLSPAGRTAVIDTSVAFEWAPVPGAVDYRLIVSTSPDIMEEASHKFNERVGGVTSYTDSGYDGDGTKYHWWVLAYDADGRSSLLPHVQANGKWFRSVTAALHGVTVSFGDVTAAGNTSYSLSPTNPYDTLPEGVEMQGQFVDITTTAVYGPPVIVGISYAPGTAEPQNLRLFHWEDGHWADVTTTVDAAEQMAYGEVTSFSWFFIGGQWVWVDDGIGSVAACFIATAAYGSSLDPRLQTFRDFRDQYLMPNPPGRALVRLYYRHSPPAADFIARHDSLRAAVRVGLLPLLGMSAFFVSTTLWQKLAVLVFAAAALAALTVLIRRRTRRRGADPA